MCQQNVSGEHSKNAEFATELKRDIPAQCLDMYSLSLRHLSHQILWHEDNQAFLMTLKAELTHEEFLEVMHKIDDWMFNKLRESQDVRAREGLKVAPYTFGFMAAKGAFHDKLPDIPNLTDAVQ
ncbi:hypothetical protein [Photobacterium arenosum]|uniref:hypothetical protein n=1 Tax=Photobacterium arenosum TaxID=2774143 RepID=UPI00288BD022|nr:hypothetical protein [Photobacterium arenosum]